MYKNLCDIRLVKCTVCGEMVEKRNTMKLDGKILCFKHIKF